jgi:hypothetical protein
VLAGSNKAALKAAIKADPEVAKVAYQAIVENQADKREKFIKEREAAGVSRDQVEAEVADDWADSAWGQAFEYATEEAGRRQRIHHLQQWAAWGAQHATELISEFSHTGVADEVEWLHEVLHNVGEVQWGLTGFIVETESENAS